MNSEARTVNMALMAARSICLSLRDECVGNAFASSGLPIRRRFRQGNSIHFRIVVKWEPTRRKSRHLSLYSSGRNYCCLRSKWSKFQLRATEDSSSPSGKSTSNNNVEVIFEMGYENNKL